MDFKRGFILECFPEEVLAGTLGGNLEAENSRLTLTSPAYARARSTALAEALFLLFFGHSFDMRDVLVIHMH